MCVNESKQQGLVFVDIKALKETRGEGGRRGGGREGGQRGQKGNSGGSRVWGSFLSYFPDMGSSERQRERKKGN